MGQGCDFRYVEKAEPAKTGRERDLLGSRVRDVDWMIIVGEKMLQEDFDSILMDVDCGR